MTVERRQVAPGFARLEASEGDDVCEIDLGYDYRLHMPEPSPLGPVLTPEELAADKTLAVHGRALARDYVDVRALMERFGGDRLLEWAAQKDPGFSREAFIYRLEQIERLPREDFAVDDAELAALKNDSAVWRDELVARERETTGLDRTRDMEPPEIGF